MLDVWPDVNVSEGVGEGAERRWRLLGVGSAASEAVAARAMACAASVAAAKAKVAAAASAKAAVGKEGVERERAREGAADQGTATGRAVHKFGWAAAFYPCRRQSR